MATYLALLRGINVGGKNIIKMADLKTCLEEIGCKEVVTYIQSGNVLFKANTSATRVAKKIEKALLQKFKYQQPVLVLPKSVLEKVIAQAPRGFGQTPTKYKYDVVFLKSDLTPKAAAKAFRLKEGVDQITVGKYVIYFSRLAAKTTQSRMSRITQTPEYQSMTIRNWNTATNLQKMIQEL